MLITRVIRAILLIAALFVFSASPSRAQSVDAQSLPSMPSVAAAMAAVASDPPESHDVFVPTSGWLVGPASLADRGGQGADAVEMPCVMMNQYNNGYIFRFSASGNKVLAMAVDFRQSAFVPGNVYNVDVAVNSGSSQTIPGTAYDQGTLILNLQRYPDFYNSLHGESVLTLGIGKKKLSFALLGANNGLTRIESCYSGSSGGASQPQNAPMRDAAISSPASLSPPAMQQLSPAVSGMTPQQNQKPEPVETRSSSGSVSGMVDKAAGDLLAQIAPAAGAPQGLSPTSSGTSPEAPRGHALAGSWTASSAKQASAKSRDIMASSTALTPLPASAPLPKDSPDEIQVAMATPLNSPISRFRAIGGTNLHEILMSWADNVNALIIWQAERDDFAVKSSVVLKGTFETAVTNLLGQFSDDPAKPVGRLYNDPRTGQKVLVINQSRDM